MINNKKKLLVFIFRTSNGVKALLILAVVSISLWAGPTRAADLSFTKFHSDITVNTDASISVVETMTVDYSSSLHGMYRTIPYRFTTLDGGEASIPISIQSVAQDGQPAQYSTSTDGTNLKLKIGNPDKTVSGTHQYTISYTAEAATNFFVDHDELYWNASGTIWDAPITNISATVNLPSSFTPEQVTTTCYTGATGSTAQSCQQSHTGSFATFSANEYLTVVVGWPVGAIIKPANYDQLRATGTPNESITISGFKGSLLLINLLLPLVALIGMWLLWRTRGRDPGRRKTIVAQYDPPDGLRPVELYCLLHERAPAKSLPTTIVDLAVRGYVKIIQGDKKTMFGWSRQDDYILQSLKAPDDNLRVYEQDLLKTLFAEHLFPANDNKLSLIDLKKRKYTTDPFAPIFRGIMSEVVGAGYFQGNPSTMRTLWTFGGIILAGMGGLLLYWSIPLFGFIPAGLFVLLFSSAMPRRTAKGVEAAWISQGFKLFLGTAEKYRIKWQERENIFEKFLPYAMVFGIADKWSKALSDVAKIQPTWYEGQPGTAFNTMVFWGAMSSFNSSINASVVSAAASGSSGFSGGSSGGGGGGGGGGGW